MAGPLAGLLVVDMTWGSPGAITGMLFADYGARVIRIERPGLVDSSIARQVWHRGKWSIELDPGADQDREVLLGLLERADVLVESLPPGQAAGPGLDRPSLRERFPRLVHTSITGYGQEGPWKDRPGFDALVSARIGQFAEQSGPRPGPRFSGHPSVAYGTAFLATIASLAALHARHRTGRGQHVDASLFDGALAQNCMNWWWNERELSYLARSGTEQGFGRGRIMTDLFVCQDGEYLMMHTGGPGGFKKTMDVLGLGDRVRAVEGALEMSVPLDDEEYEVTRHVAPEVFKTRPRAEWIELFHAADLAALPVLRPGEILEDEQVVFADAVMELAGDDGPLRAAGAVIAFRGSPAGVPGPAPAVGANDADVRAILSSPTPAATALSPSAAPTQALDGLRVLDFSSFFAAGYAAKLLNDLGADVIKIEPLVGDQMRPLPDPFEACQRGKRNIALDIKSDAGRQIVRQLLETADVAILNLRPGKAEKVGLGYEELKAIKPDIIYCYLPGFGSKGPKSHLKSFAPLVSGFTGLLWESAGEGADKPVRRAMGNEDYNNGFVGALSIMMALRHRDETGEGQAIESPQLHSNLLVMTHNTLDANGNLVSPMTLDKDQMGWGPLYRLYETADGWLCIAVVGDAALGRLGAALELDLPAGLTYAGAVRGHPLGDALAVLLEAKFAGLKTEEATAFLEAHDVPCEVALEHPYMPDFLWEDWALHSGRVLEHEHPIYGLIREIGWVMHLSDSPNVNKGPGALLGQHTRDILTELGYHEGEQDQLVSSGVCIAANIDSQSETGDDE